MRIPRHLPLLLLAATGALLVSACNDGGPFGTVEVAVEARPERIVIDPLWGGSTRTRNVTIENTGEATVTVPTPRIVDADGPAEIEVELAGETLRAGASVSLAIVLRAERDIAGLFTASVMIEVDGTEPIEIEIEAPVRPSPECDDDNPCTTDSFDLVTGGCIFTEISDFAGCDDGNACTDGDVCLTGRCIGNPVVCNDNIECTIDGCNAESGCVFEPAASRCNDENDCTNDQCTPGFGCENPAADIGTLCHFNGCIDIGFCAAAACVIQPVPNGAPCEDGDLCTINDTCQSGECTAGPPTVVGAADPVLLTDGPLEVDSCRHPFTPTCGPPAEAYPAEVLAVQRAGPVSAVVFRTSFIDTQSRQVCDPRDYAATQPFPVIIDVDAGPVPDPEDRAADAGAGEAPPDPPVPEPPSPVCAAAVYVAAYAPPPPFPLNAPPTLRMVRLGAVRGPTAAVISNADAITQSIEVRVVHADHLSRTDLYLQTFQVGAAGIQSQAVEYLAWPEVPGIVPERLLMAAAGAESIVVGIPSNRALCIADCNDDGPPTTQLPVWRVAPNDAPNAPPISIVGVLNLADQSVCGAAFPPTDFANGSLSVQDSLVALTFTMSIGGCINRPQPWLISYSHNDGNLPQALYFPLDTTPESTGGVDAGVLLDGGAGTLDGGEGGPPFSTAPDVTGIEHNNRGETLAVVREVECEVAGGCRQVVLTENGDTTVLFDRIPSTGVSAAPLDVEGNNRAAVFYGARAEMRWKDEEQSLRRLPAPSLPPEYAFEGERVVAVRGLDGQSIATLGNPIDGDCTVGGDCRPNNVDSLPVGRVVVLQNFACGYGAGERDLGEACEDADDCGEGLGCDHLAGCQPPPDCESGPCLSECWGVCTVPVGPCLDRQLTLCDVDETCRLLPGIDLCLPVEDCEPGGCLGGEECVVFVEPCGEDGCDSAAVCMPAPPDPSDGGVVDGGAPNDGGEVDGGIVDGGAPNDGGEVDGGIVDGGVADGGVPDGGIVDGGAPDGGIADGGGA